MRLDHPLPVALTLCAFAGAALYALDPRPNDQLEGEIAMLEPSLALERLNAADNGPALSHNLAMTHAALALDAGAFEVVAGVLDKISAQDADSAEAEQLLAEARGLSGDAAGEAAHLAAAYALAPSATLRERLGLAYRLSAQPGKERDLLLSVPGRDLVSAEARRLADLLRQERRYADLERLYRDRADRMGPDADAAKQFLLSFLLEAGRPSDAQQQVMRWFLAAGRDQQVLETAIPVFVQREALDEAMSLAVAVLDVAPDTSLGLALTFLDGGHRDRALAFQQAWLDRMTTIPEAAWPALISLAERTGRLDGLRSALARTPPDALSADLLSQALLQFLRYDGVSSLYPQAVRLRPDVLDRRPLLGAAWASSQGDQRQAAAFLDAAARGEMSDWDWQIWAGIARSLAGTPAYQGLLAVAPAGSPEQSVLQAAFRAPATAQPPQE